MARKKKKKLRKVPREPGIIAMKKRRAGAFDDKRKSKKNEKIELDRSMEE